MREKIILADLLAKRNDEIGRIAQKALEEVGEEACV